MSECNEHDLQSIRGKITDSTSGRPVFFKGMWMAMPLPFSPPAANGEVDTKSEQSSRCAIKIFGSIVPYLWQCNRLRDFCQRQDIPFFLVTGISESKERKKVVQDSSWTKTKPLSGKRFRAFLKFLPSPIRVMAELYWFINRKMFQKIGLFYGWEELCYIATDALPDPCPGVPTVMTFYRTSKYGARGEHHVAHYLPAYLEKRIRSLISNDSILIFRQANGAPFSTDRLAREFSIASEKAKRAGVISENVRLLSLREPIDPEWEKNARPGTFPASVGIEIAASITEKQIEAVQNLLSHCYHNAGAKPKHPLRLILEAICWRELTGQAWRSLPTLPYPPWRAVQSQHQRWKEKGILSKILEIIVK
jgi:Putative transposase of IS4/5 family (DUF4096)